MARTATPMTELGRRLDDYRTQSGWTVGQMVDHVGTSRQVYLGWIRGATPSVENIYEIARVLEVTPCDILEWVRPATIYADAGATGATQSMPG